MKQTKKTVMVIVIAITVLASVMVSIEAEQKETKDIKIQKPDFNKWKDEL